MEKHRHKTKQDFYYGVGKDIKKFRESLGVTTQELAIKTRHTIEYIESLERGVLPISLWSFYNVMNALEKIEAERGKP